MVNWKGNADGGTLELATPKRPSIDDRKAINELSRPGDPVKSTAYTVKVIVVTIDAHAYKVFADEHRETAPCRAFVQLDVPNCARHVRSEKPAPNPSWNAIRFPFKGRSNTISCSNAIRFSLRRRSSLRCMRSHALQGKAYDRIGGQILATCE